MFPYIGGKAHHVKWMNPLFPNNFSNHENSDGSVIAPNSRSGLPRKLPIFESLIWGKVGSVVLLGAIDK